MKVITIGRDESNDRVITDPYTSQHHLQIIQHDDGHFTLSDFGSTNGTYVNGQKISGEIPLNDMDIVRIGNTTIPWRMYFEDVENIIPQKMELSQPESEIPAVKDANKKQGFVAMKTKYKLFIVFSAVYILVALVLVCVGSINPSSLIGSIIGAVMFIIGIWVKARLDDLPVHLSQPDGKKPSSLLTISGIGQIFIGGIKFRKVEETYVSYTFFSLLFPIYPTGCYRVTRISSNEWVFHGSEKKESSEITCIYLVLYGMLIWIFALFFSFIF